MAPSVEFKLQSQRHYEDRIKGFVKEAEQAEEKFYFEDDHFDRWRPLNQFRDSKNQERFKAFKAFVHRPNSDMKSLLD